MLTSASDTEILILLRLPVCSLRAYALICKGTRDYLYTTDIYIYLKALRITGQAVVSLAVAKCQNLQLLKWYINVKHTNHNIGNILMGCVLDNGSPECLDYIQEVYPKAVTSRNWNVTPSIEKAVKTNDIKMLKALDRFIHNIGAQKYVCGRYLDTKGIHVAFARALKFKSIPVLNYIINNNDRLAYQCSTDKPKDLEVIKWISEHGPLFDMVLDGRPSLKTLKWYFESGYEIELCLQRISKVARTYLLQRKSMTGVTITGDPKPSMYIDKRFFHKTGHKYNINSTNINNYRYMEYSETPGAGRELSINEALKQGGVIVALHK